MSGYSPGRVQFRQSFELCPIFLTNGVALPGGSLPIVVVTQAGNYDQGPLAGANVPIEDYFAHYQVIPGGTIVDNEFGEYPFANQAVAANAIIFSPLTVSLLMICPANPNTGGYANKTAVFQSLAATLRQHNLMGGTYTVVTPAKFYVNCLLRRLSEVSPPNDTKQVQAAWRWDFEQPLLTQADATQAYNATMGKIAAALPFDGSTSGVAGTVNAPATTAGVPLFPANASSVGGQLGIAPDISSTFLT